MDVDLITINQDVCSALQEKKYATILAGEFSVAPQLTDARQRLWADWNDLPPDNYLKDGASFRLRRFAYFYFLPSTGEVRPFPPTPYFQARELNSYAGGIQRKFSHLHDSTLTNQFLYALIRFNFQQFPVSKEMAQQPWKLDVHQIRIVATPGEAGEPTPEGIHHDENDFVCMHLANRQNTVGGVNTIYDNNRRALISCTLHEPMDSLIVWDPHVMHGVSSIQPQHLDEQAVRDILLIGYSYDQDLKPPTSTTDTFRSQRTF